MRYRKPMTTTGLIAALGGMMLAAAVAQTPAPPRDPNMPDPKTVPPEKIAPPLTTGSIGQTLSDKLGKSDGVITPPPQRRRRHARQAPNAEPRQDARHSDARKVAHRSDPAEVVASLTGLGWRAQPSA